MAGNTKRPGATRRPGSKKGATVGSGGNRRRGLEGKGPTPRAEDRVGHKAYRARSRAEAGEGGPGRGKPAARRTPPTARGGSEIVAGRNAVVEALRAHVPVTTLYVTRGESDDRVKEALKAAQQRGIPVLATPRGELDRLTGGAAHQGLAVQMPAYEYVDPHDLLDPAVPGIPLVVALDGVTDPRNLGAVLRSVAAFGGHGVVVPQRRSAGMTAAAWKASAGAAARVPVALATNLTRALEDFRKAGFFVVGLDMDGEVALPGLGLADQPLVVVLGSEGKGLSRLVRETCDQVISIPMAGSMESLNVSVAAGVTLYEVARRRSDGTAT